VGKYRKIPVVNDCQRWEGDWDALQEWLDDMDLLPAEVGQAPPVSRNHDGSLYIATFEGVLKAELGHWLIRGQVGELYFNRPHVFHRGYEEVA
jgi:hypothetical protein